MDESMNEWTEVAHSRQGLMYGTNQVGGTEDWVPKGDKITHGDCWEFVREESYEHLSVIEANFFNWFPSFRGYQGKVAVKKSLDFDL